MVGRPFQSTPADFMEGFPEEPEQARQAVEELARGAPELFRSGTRQRARANLDRLKSGTSRVFIADSGELKGQAVEVRKCLADLVRGGYVGLVVGSIITIINGTFDIVVNGIWPDYARLFLFGPLLGFLCGGGIRVMCVIMFAGLRDGYVDMREPHRKRVLWEPGWIWYGVLGAAFGMAFGIARATAIAGFGPGSSVHWIGSGVGAISGFLFGAVVRVFGRRWLIRAMQMLMALGLGAFIGVLLTGIVDYGVGRTPIAGWGYLLGAAYAVLTVVFTWREWAVRGTGSGDSGITQE